MATCKDCVHVEVCEDLTKAKLSPKRAEELLSVLREYGRTCDHFKDRSRFVELPNDFPKGRLTTNKPLGNFDALMNYAYAKDGNVLIRYANNQENMDFDNLELLCQDCHNKEHAGDMKSGKSKTLFAAAIAEYMAYCDKEYGAEIYCLAPKLDQAELVFNSFYTSVQQEEELAELKKTKRR